MNFHIMSINTKKLFAFSLVAMCLAGTEFCSASDTSVQKEKESAPSGISPTPVLDAERVSIALASVMESRVPPANAGELANQPSPVSPNPGIEEEKGYISTGSNEQTAKYSAGQKQVELSSSSRSAADDIVREIVVLDKQTGSKYKVITVKFPSEEDIAEPRDVDSSVQVNDKPETAVASAGADQKEQQTGGAADPKQGDVAEESKATDEKESDKKDDKKADARQVEQSQKAEKKNDKKKNKEVVDKENEKKSVDKTSSKQEKKRSKRNVGEQKSQKGKGKYSSKNRKEKKSKSKGKY